MAKVARLETVGDPTNDGKTVIEFQTPYTVQVTIEGTATYLFHRWSCDEVEEKGNAAKGSKAKKTDNVESFVYRLPNRHLGIPGEQLRQSIINAAKYKQDPRSPRKSMMDLFKAGIVSLTELADVGKADWDYLDRRRVMIQRNAVTRSRPGLYPGWKVTFNLECLIPEYISPELLHQVTANAGRLVGVGNFRPTFGRFAIVKWDVLTVTS